jgi:NADPH:quinone reductase-like Zn-dependent oxidoreductase
VGASGNVGPFVVQIAKSRGAHVTGVASGDKLDFVRSLGADEVIDYRTTRFEDAVADLDLVIDTVGGDTWERSWDVLRPGGRLVSIAVPRPPDRESVDRRSAIWFVVKPDHRQLTEIGGLIAAGHLRPIVSAVLPLARGREAYGATGQRVGPGKIVLLAAGAPGTEGETASAQRAGRAVTAE